MHARRRFLRGALGVALAAVLAGGFAAAAPAPAKEPPRSVRWRRTYGLALLEARLRNVPVLVTRHKDG